MPKRLELVSGLAASGFGILGLIYAILGPTSHSVGTAISVGPSGSTSLAQRGLDPAAIVFFALVLLILVGVAVGAYWHSQRGVKAGLTLLWTLTGLLWIAVILGAASIGILLLPAAVLASVTVAAGSRVQARNGTAERP